MTATLDFHEAATESALKRIAAENSKAWHRGIKSKVENKHTFHRCFDLQWPGDERIRQLCGWIQVASRTVKVAPRMSSCHETCHKVTMLFFIGLEAVVKSLVLIYEGNVSTSTLRRHCLFQQKWNPHQDGHDLHQNLADWNPMFHDLHWFAALVFGVLWSRICSLSLPVFYLPSKQMKDPPCHVAFPLMNTVAVSPRDVRPERASNSWHFPIQ